MRRGPLACGIAALWGGCMGGGAGTAVGNPGDADVKARELDDGIVLDAVEIPVAAWRGWTCDGEVLEREAHVVLDGLAPSPDPIRIRAREYCRQSLSLEGPVRALGATLVGTAFDVSLPVGALSVDGRVRVDGQHLLFEVPLALDAAELDEIGGPVTLGPEDPRAVAWAAEGAADASLWIDDDDDGLISPSDRLVAVWDTGAPLAALATRESDDCGCDASPRSLPAHGLALAAALLARRRRAYPSRTSTSRRRTARLTP